MNFILECFKFETLFSIFSPTSRISLPFEKEPALRLYFGEPNRQIPLCKKLIALELDKTGTCKCIAETDVHK